MGPQDAAHVDAGAPAPDPRLEKVPGDPVLEDLFRQGPDVSHPHGANHRLRERRPVSTDLPHLGIVACSPPRRDRRISVEMTRQRAFQEIQVPLAKLDVSNRFVGTAGSQALPQALDIGGDQGRGPEQSAIGVVELSPPCGRFFQLRIKIFRTPRLQHVLRLQLRRMRGLRLQLRQPQIPFGDLLPELRQTGCLLFESIFGLAGPSLRGLKLLHVITHGVR